MSRSHSIGRMLRNAAGWLLLATLFYAPWDYGATGASAIRNLNRLLGAVVLLWFIGSLLRGRRTARSDRAASWTLLTMGALLLLTGWGMTVNAHFIHDADEGIFLPLSAPYPAMPGSVGYALSLAWMGRATALLGCIWVVAGLAQDEKWLRRIWWAIGLAGASIALFGLVEKATGAPMIFWEAPEPNDGPEGTFFATFYYHGNAGAFLNLVLPAVLGLAFRYVARRAHPGARALWLTLSLVMIVAVISDTSRMGQSIAVLMVILLLASVSGKIFRRARQGEPRTIAIAFLVVVTALWAVARVSHLDRSLHRWDQLQKSVTQDARWLVDKVAVAALPHAGTFGFGPGTFRAIFPVFNQGDLRTGGDWLFLHNDYLQTLLEWGWLGGLLWAGIFFGGLLVAFLRLSDARATTPGFPRRSQLLPLAMVALAGLALHAAVDFPLQIASIQLYAATYLGICWGSGSWTKKTAENEPALMRVPGRSTA